jgi:hypothetical protein
MEDTKNWMAGLLGRGQAIEPETASSSHRPISTAL